MTSKPPSPWTIRSAPALEAFGELWPKMGDAGGPARTIFQGRDYLAAWQATIGAARKTTPIFIRVDDADGDPLLLAALGVERVNGARFAGFLDGGVVDYPGPVLFPKAAKLTPADAPALWAAIQAHLAPHDIVKLAKTPLRIGGIDNPFAQMGGAAGAPSGHSFPLDADYAAYRATRLSGAKKQGQKRRGLAKRGVTRTRIAETTEEALALMAEMIRLKTHRYLETRGVDGFDRPGYRAYFPEMTRRFFDAGHIHASTLEVDGVAIAAHWGLVGPDRFYALMLANTDGQWAQFSPAMLLCEDLVAWSYARGLGVFDFGIGDAEYKARFSAEPVALGYHMRAETLVGRGYLAAKSARDALAASGVLRRLRGAKTKTEM